MYVGGHGLHVSKREESLQTAFLLLLLLLSISDIVLHTFEVMIHLAGVSVHLHKAFIRLI